MIKTNKIIAKRLLPGSLVIGVGIPAMIAFFAYGAHEDIQTKNYKNPEDKIFTIATMSMLAACGLCILLLPIIESYQNDYKIASHMARDFLRNTMKEHPEFKKFEKVLSNPRAIRSVATMISNSLRNSEQKRVLEIANKLNKIINNPSLTKQEHVAAFRHASEQITKIIQEHAAVHPEFIDELLIAMAHADTTYVIPVQQRVR